MFTGILNDIVNKAKENKKRIVLPESEDIRILQAASIISNNDIAEIVLVGNQEKIKDIANLNNVDLKNIKIIDPVADINTQKYINALFDLRKNKGMTLDMATSLILNEKMYFATMMVKLGDADGVVSGAIHSTADTLRPALQIIKSKPDVTTVSAFFLMETKKKNLGKNGIFVFGDCGLVEFPTEEQLVDISIESARSFKSLTGYTPRVALLSYSTKGSAKNEAVDKLARVVNKLNTMNLEFCVDGELQLDAAIIPEVAKLKAPESEVAGNANVLIFPDLQAGNIGYKLAQRFGDMLAIGPITQGLNKPINDLSRGCNVDDIVGAVAITAIQANVVNE